MRELIKLKAIYELLEIDHRPLRGRGQPDRGHRPRELLSRTRRAWKPSRPPSGSSRCWSSLALAFDFMNGFHDAANSIATVVSTGVLKPQQAVLFAAFFNFVAIFVFQLKVAATVGKGIVAAGRRRPPRGVRRADRRHHLEHHHLVVRHSRRVRRMR